MAPGAVQLNIFAWNQKLTKYVKDGQPEKAIQLFQQMQQGVTPNKFTFVLLINACAGLGALECGRHVHGQLIQSGCESTCLCGQYVAWWTCMQNVGASSMPGVCSTRCHCEMWSLGMPWFWDM
jgi:pentatricopeptide repeat protein